MDALTVVDHRRVIAENRWRVSERTRLAWVDWDDGYSSVFSGETCETHLLSTLPAEILRDLQGAMATEAELADRFAMACEVEANGEWHEKISGILRDLACADLIEAV